MSMDAIAKKLDTKLSKWKPEISREVRAQVSQAIDAADNDALDVMRSRAVEQEVANSSHDLKTSYTLAPILASYIGVRRSSHAISMPPIGKLIGMTLTRTIRRASSGSHLSSKRSVVTLTAVISESSSSRV